MLLKISFYRFNIREVLAWTSFCMLNTLFYPILTLLLVYRYLPVTTADLQIFYYFSQTLFFFAFVWHKRAKKLKVFSLCFRTGTSSLARERGRWSWQDLYQLVIEAASLLTCVLPSWPCTVANRATCRETSRATCPLDAESVFTSNAEDDSLDNLSNTSRYKVSSSRRKL